LGWMGWTGWTGWLTRCVARIGARRSGVIATHPRRYAGRPGYVSTSARQVLRLGHSDALPRAGETDPRHGVPPRAGYRARSGRDGCGETDSHRGCPFCDGKEEGLW